jgi:hypothetical protein
MADSSLTAIEQKVRRLTRSPSESQLSTAELDNYIDTFVLYDFPAHLRLFNLREQFTFYTAPYVDTYTTTTLTANDPLYNFKNKYISVHDPVYVAGYPAFYSQSRTQFFGMYPIVNSIQSIGTTGDGSTRSFSGTLPNVPMLRNNVLFDSIDSTTNALALVDTPISNTIGNLSIPNMAPTSTTAQDLSNYVNYVTGEFVITFNTAPGAGQAINCQNVPYVAALPQSLLFFDDTFTLRPVPDQTYRVNFEVYARPTALLITGQPQLEEWWQYIAYGAAKKIFEDRMDTDSVAQIMPEFKQQELLVLRRTLVQQTNVRTATIYTEQAGNDGSNGFGGWGGV